MELSSLKKFHERTFRAWKVKKKHSENTSHILGSGTF